MNLYYPEESILIEIVDKFNKRNETTIGYLRNQFNALENYVIAYCRDHNKFLVSRSGMDTGINYKFRNALFDAVSAKHEIANILNSREVNTLFHFTPMIYDDETGDTFVHEDFVNAYKSYRNNPFNIRCQKETFSLLCKLIYLVRCNIAHTGKVSCGPNRAKIERDNSIAKLIVSINLLIFDCLMNHPEKKLASYGTLLNSPYVSKMDVNDGVVNGFTEILNGLSYFTYELNTGEVSVKLYTSSTRIVFTDIDNYEGDSYERIYIPVKCGDEIHIANIYERKYFYE